MKRVNSDPGNINHTTKRSKTIVMITSSTTDQLPDYPAPTCTKSPPKRKKSSSFADGDVNNTTIKRRKIVTTPTSSPPPPYYPAATCTQISPNTSSFSESVVTPGTASSSSSASDEEDDDDDEDVSEDEASSPRSQSTEENRFSPENRFYIASFRCQPNSMEQSNDTSDDDEDDENVILATDWTATSSRDIEHNATTTFKSPTTRPDHLWHLPKPLRPYKSESTSQWTNGFGIDSSSDYDEHELISMLAKLSPRLLHDEDLRTPRDIEITENGIEDFNSFNTNGHQL